MQVIIKFINNNHTQFVTGREYKAVKMKEGYFVKSEGVSKLIPAVDVRELECKYCK